MRHYSSATFVAATALVAMMTSATSGFALDVPFRGPRGSGSISAEMMTACPVAPPPPKDLPHESRYDADDQTHSKVDTARQAAYDTAIKPLRAFQSKVVEAANDAFADPKNVKKAACVLAWLKNWADGNALAGMAVDSQSRFNSDQAQSSFGLAYLQVAGFALGDPKVRPGIAAWLRDLALGTRRYYDKDAGEMSRANNHRYFGALAVASAAVAAEDAELFAWAMDTYEKGVCSATAEGALPMEMKRGSRARYYEAFALGPLVLLAEFAERNGIPAYGKCDGAVHRIVSFSMNSMSDPSAVEAIAGEKQMALPDGKLPGSLVAWLAPYARRFPDGPAASTRAEIGKMSSTALGGNLGLLYGFGRG
jgi:poly(beta-D-mannuronate) lyase